VVLFRHLQAPVGEVVKINDVNHIAPALNLCLDQQHSGKKGLNVRDVFVLEESGASRQVIKRHPDKFKSLVV